MELIELTTKIELLETRQAFQEDTVESLNTVIIQLQKDIEQLNLNVKLLLERIEQSVSPQSESSKEELPPHY